MSIVYLFLKIVDFYILGGVLLGFLCMQRFFGFRRGEKKNKKNCKTSSRIVLLSCPAELYNAMHGYVLNCT